MHLDDDNLRHRAVCAVSEALRWLEPTIETTRIFRVNRAEPSTNEGNRPDTAFVTKCNNLIVAWPTKLALAPALADQILPMLEINPVVLGNLNGRSHRKELTHGYDSTSIGSNWP